MKKLFLFFFVAFNLNAGTHIVTTNADDGEGSLRKIVADANANDTIIFASNIDIVYLTTEQITINKNLTIIGNKDTKTAISGKYDLPTYTSRIFNICDSNITFNISNLIIENGKVGPRSGGIDTYGSYNSNITANNCVFRNNFGYSGGAASIVGYKDSFTAINCSFENNKTVGSGGSVWFQGSIFISINCSFTNNSYTENCYGGAVTVFGNAIFIPINSTFYNNNAIKGSAIYIHMDTKTAHLLHTTFDKNKADSSGAVFNRGTLYSYNSIYTDNTEDGVVTAEGQIRGTISGNGKNLIEGKDGVTREKVFGNNEYKDGFIMPTAFAKKAERLTTMDIANPVGIMTDDSIINLLITDQINYKRPDTGFVTYGAIEYDSTYGIKADGSFDILVLPNPTDRDFNIIFDNPREQKITIDLVDVEGKIILNIFDGVASAGWQVYRVKEKLASSVYFVKFAIKDNLFIRKVVVK